ncbi:MAG: OsmC family protein [Synechococcus sp.]|nr:OsmC family protein [Synechococcus sp.]
MTFIACRYEGGLRCQALHEPSATELLTDAPPDNQGRGECFSPTDLVATALATCILTIMGITAERHGWPLEGATARVEKSMTTTGARRIEKLEVWIHLPADLEEASRVVLRRAAETCPVKRSLQGSVAMEIHWS